MKKNDFRLTSKVQTIANLSLAMYAAVIITCAIFIYKMFNSTLITFIGMAILYLICACLNIIAAKKLKKIKFKGTSKQIAQEAYKQSFYFIFPLMFAITMQKLRTAMWQHYSDSQTKHLEKESEIIKCHINLLKTLKEDGYVSTYTYNKQMLRYKENLTKILAIENKKEKELQIKKTVMESKWD